MEFGGRYIVDASRLRVWEALNDAHVLKASIPGCKRIQWVSDTRLEAEIGVNLGVVKPVFTGDLILTRVVPAESYTLTGRGRGGFLGMAEASADIVLTDAGAATRLVFRATGGASGQIMTLGQKLVGHSAQRVIDGFFERFGTAMGAKVTPLAPEPDDGPDAH